MALEQYRKKRSFGKTPEPRGTAGRSGKTALSFVVQKHDASHLHYDFRLELDGVLKSWAVPKGPSMNPRDKRLAMMVEDHPLSYAGFEGEIPQGQYGAGDVIVWDRGYYTASGSADPETSRKALKRGLFEGELSFVLLGEKLKGGFTLVRMKGRGENAWLLIKAKDEYARTSDITKDTRSVATGSTLPRDRGAAQTDPAKQAAPKRAGRAKRAPAPRASARQGVQGKKAPMPHHIRPMLAELVGAPFDRPGWFFEVKWDGYRAIAEIARGKVQLYSRNGISFTERYAPVSEALRALEHDCILDGEIIALKNGRPDFHTLQRYQEEEAPLQYAVFDLLYLDGRDVRQEPLRERARLLREIIPEGDARIIMSEHGEGVGIAFFRQMQEAHLEGMVAKDAESPYREGSRNGEWQKVKTHQEQEAIIIGFTAPRGSRKELGALVLGAYDHGTLRYIGHSGGGMSDKELADLHAKLLRIKTAKPPVAEKVPINSTITWVTPRYVCVAKFTEWTTTGRMRHPIYAGLRVDKKPAEVVIERAAPVKAPAKAGAKRRAKKAGKARTARSPAADPSGELVLTHRDKVFWPELGYTKGDMLDYYDRMSETILPYLVHRPESLHRFPNGIHGTSFFQKNVEGDLPSFVTTERIWSESNGEELRYVVCDNKETLLYLANLGCIELNPWNSQVGRLDRPDYLILDLDPHDRPFDELIIVAQEVKKALDLACEEHYPKTSGKSGIHIMVPLGARYRYEDAKSFAELIMRIVHEKLPDLTSLERTPSKRGGKIYLDYLQNRYAQTAAAAYSTRPTKEASVSTPLEWREVKKGLDPREFTIRTVPKRIAKKGDLWKDVLTRGVELKDAIRCLEAHAQ